MPKRIEPTVPAELIEQKIFLIRGHKVMLDRDLATLYRVTAIALRQQVKRNPARFPEDFFFQLTHDEASRLGSQNVIPGRHSFGGSLPYAFTEQGVAMLSSVLKSARAAEVNVAIMRVFVKIRTLLASHADLLRRLDQNPFPLSAELGSTRKQTKSLEDSRAAVGRWSPSHVLTPPHWSRPGTGTSAMSTGASRAGSVLPLLVVLRLVASVSWPTTGSLWIERVPSPFPLEPIEGVGRSSNRTGNNPVLCASPPV